MDQIVDKEILICYGILEENQELDFEREAGKGEWERKKGGRSRCGRRGGE